MNKLQILENRLKELQNKKDFVITIQKKQQIEVQISNIIYAIEYEELKLIQDE